MFGMAMQRQIYIVRVSHVNKAVMDANFPANLHNHSRPRHTNSAFICLLRINVNTFLIHSVFPFSRNQNYFLSATTSLTANAANTLPIIHFWNLNQVGRAANQLAM